MSEATHKTYVGIDKKCGFLHVLALLCGHSWNMCTKTVTLLSTAGTLLYSHTSTKHWHAGDLARRTCCSCHCN